MTEATASGPSRVLFLCVHNSSRHKWPRDCCECEVGRATRCSAPGRIRAPCIRWPF
jgi:hypothetical protein